MQRLIGRAKNRSPRRGGIEVLSCYNSSSKCTLSSVHSCTTLQPLRSLPKMTIRAIAVYFLAVVLCMTLPASCVAEGDPLLICCKPLPNIRMSASYEAKM
jgi:hypothetical protein